MSTLLEVSGVSVSFDGFKAINNLSIQIGEAETSRDYWPERCRQNDLSWIL